MNLKKRLKVNHYWYFTDDELLIWGNAGRVEEHSKQYKEAVQMCRFVNDTHWLHQPIKLMEAQMTLRHFVGIWAISNTVVASVKKGADTEDEARKIQQYAMVYLGIQGDKITV